MTEELRAVWQGSFELFGTTVRAYVLSDGQRVLDAADLELMLGGMQAGAPTPTPEQMEAFAHWQRGES